MGMALQASVATLAGQEPTTPLYKLSMFFPMGSEFTIYIYLGSVVIGLRVYSLKSVVTDQHWVGTAGW